MKIKCVLASCVLFFAPWSHALDLVDALQRAKVNDPNWQANLLQYEADQLNLDIDQIVILGIDIILLGRKGIALCQQNIDHGF